jgi:hypothetical protein
MLARFLSTTAVALATVAVVAQVALAWGEPKNEWPFTRPVDGRAPQAATHQTSQTQPTISGEPKNQPPFTGTATVIVASGGGFDWSSGAIGAAAGLGIALAGAGALAIAHRSPRTA